MAKKTKLEARLNGEVVDTRTTDHPYTAAVILLQDGKPVGAYSWHSRMDLAHRELAKAEKNLGQALVRAAAVEEELAAGKTPANKREYHERWAADTRRRYAGASYKITTDIGPASRGSN